MAGIYLSLGSNLGNRAANIALALRMLGPLVRVEAVSRLYQSPPADGSDQPDFYNAACRVVTGLGADLLLAHAKRVEHMIGRRPAPRWAPRPIDIDIALYGDLVLESEALTVPHPRLGERAFVLFPLLDLDPRLIHPQTGTPLSDLASRQQRPEVIAEGEWWRDARTIGVRARSAAEAPAP
ncbi:MAG TPA: 2-amino-4-hydroxy-6-hydroxymethyldihydropteridine diphosphokinase [Dehalococcoidia bacterium]|nr:2-amino-4-hydroxy-6-hydroxymethyldihydropteridine diphosphokinase [Dehalococcoidia bacterium]